jgi:uncharacterized phage protein (TIGR01671 family)
VREIKFRCWDNQNKTWYDPIYEASDGNLFELLVSLSGDLCAHTLRGLEHESMWPTRFTLMQYTGLKDKNGKEIYEGDIVNTLRVNRLESSGNIPENCCGKETDREERNNEVVKFEDFMWMCAEDQTLAMFTGVQDDDYYVEVIGNIYENPDLLKSNA